MQQITILTGEEKDETLATAASRVNQTGKDRIVFQFKEFLNKYLKRELPDFEGKTVTIDKIPSWELQKMYRIIINLDYQFFTLIVHYKAGELVNKYS